MAAIDLWSGELFSPGQILGAAPAIPILFAAGVEWSARKQPFRYIGAAAGLAVLALCVLEDATYLTSRTEDLQSEVAAASTLLTPNSCVVFVSEKLSKAMFLVFDPELGRHECLNFFHRRLILASQPYVRPDQQHDAESYFRGLNFLEVKRMRFYSGQIVVMEQTQ